VQVGKKLATDFTDLKGKKPDREKSMLGYG
jgi:hypothetical protein